MVPIEHTTLSSLVPNVCKTLVILYIVCAAFNGGLVSSQFSFPQNITRKENSQNITAILNMLVDPNGPLNYDKRLRPNYGGEAVEVGITIHVSSISAVTEVEMDYTIDMYLRQTWKDTRLSFNGGYGDLTIGVEYMKRIWIPDTFSRDYTIDMYLRQTWKDTRLSFDGGYGDLTIGVEYMKSIWIPDTFFPNEKKSFFHDATTHNSFLRITSKGDVLTSQRLTVIATCPMELQLFPLDSQRCHLEIESYGYSTRDIIYKWDKGERSVVQSQYKLPQFRVNGFYIKSKQQMLSTGNYSRLSCTFKFTRSIGFYLIQVYLPSQLIVIISWVSFWLSRDATPARVALGVTTVLTMTTLMTTTNAAMPKGLLPAKSGRYTRSRCSGVTTVLTMTTLMTTTNAAMPKVSYIKSIDIYLITCFFMVFATLLEYAIVGYMNKKLRMKKETNLKSPFSAISSGSSAGFGFGNGDAGGVISTRMVSSSLALDPRTSPFDTATLPSFSTNGNLLSTSVGSDKPVVTTFAPSPPPPVSIGSIKGPRGFQYQGSDGPALGVPSSPGSTLFSPNTPQHQPEPIYATSPGFTSPMAKVLGRATGYKKMKPRYRHTTPPIAQNNYTSGSAMGQTPFAPHPQQEGLPGYPLRPHPGATGTAPSSHTNQIDSVASQNLMTTPQRSILKTTHGMTFPTTSRPRTTPSANSARPPP